MSGRTITVTLPEALYQRVWETATASSLSFDEVLARRGPAVFDPPDTSSDSFRCRFLLRYVVASSHVLLDDRRKLWVVHAR